MRERAACTVCEVHAESTFRVEGMDCHEEVALISRRLKRLSGLEAFSADVIAGRLHVQYDAARLTAGSISAAVADTGMRAWLEHEEPHLSSTSQTRFLLLIASGLSLAAAIVAGWLGWPIASRVLRAGDGGDRRRVSRRAGLACAPLQRARHERPDDDRRRRRDRHRAVV